jgi:hypothetical protein
MVLVSRWRSSHSLTLRGLSLNTRRIAPANNATSALARLAVAFSPSGSLTDRALFASLVPAIGGEESNFMSSKIRYTDEPLGKPKVVPDFLPTPEDLVFRDEGVKITLSLSKRSVDFFKQEAAKHNTQYQRMIRRLLDAYAEHHAQPLTSRSTRTRLRRAG